MAALMMRSVRLTDARLSNAVPRTTAAAPPSLRSRRAPVIVRAEAPSTPETEAAPAPQEPPSNAVPVAASAATAAAGGTSNTVAVQDFQIFSPTTEAINGRAAMLGFVAAVVAELTTGQSVWSQIAGKMVNEKYVEKATGLSGITFAGAVVLLTIATFAPMVLNNEGLSSRSFGPFKPSLEITLGRVAMLGFTGLVLVETLVRNNTAIF